jgi:hypothetical protein
MTRGGGGAISMSIAAAWAKETAASGASRAKVSVRLKGACAGRGAGLLRFKVQFLHLQRLDSL